MTLLWAARGLDAASATWIAAHDHTADPDVYLPQDQKGNLPYEPM
jgi:hypothetical protein